jgi:trans-aconitate 2-methyltransferase
MMTLGRIGSPYADVMGTPWDARTYDRSSEPQQAWASEVLARLADVATDATVLDVGCGTGRVTEALLALVPRGRVLAVDASADMVRLARNRLGDRAEVWHQDVLDLDLDEAVDAIVSTAALHWVTDHDRLWVRLARALRPGGRLEVQCGGEGNIARVRELIATVARDVAPELVGWSPWVFAGPRETERRLRRAGFRAPRCWLEERPTNPHDVDAFVRTSILPAHLARLPTQRRERFATAVVGRVSLPLDYVRLNVSARAEGLAV